MFGVKNVEIYYNDNKYPTFDYEDAYLKNPNFLISESISSNIYIHKENFNKSSFDEITRKYDIYDSYKISDSSNTLYYLVKEAKVFFYQNLVLTLISLSAISTAILFLTYMIFESYKKKFVIANILGKKHMSIFKHLYFQYALVMIFVLGFLIVYKAFLVHFIMYFIILILGLVFAIINIKKMINKAIVVYIKGEEI